MEMEKLQNERDSIKEQLDGVTSLIDHAKKAVLKSEEKCWNLKNEVENMSEEIASKNSDINRLNEELSIKCEDLEAFNLEMMTKYKIIEELQNSLKDHENKTDGLNLVQI